MEKLRAVLDDMVSLSHSFSTETVTGDDEETETIVTLHITLTQKSIDEMMEQYGFSADQKSSYPSC